MSLSPCDALVFEKIFEILGPSSLAEALLVCKRWRGFLDHRIAFALHERSHWSKRDFLVDTRGPECTVAVCKSFGAARVHLEDQMATYQTLLAREFGRISNCPYEVKKVKNTVAVVKKMVDFKAMGYVPMRSVAIRREWKWEIDSLPHLDKNSEGIER
jgi:hypothetical protein